MKQYYIPILIVKANDTLALSINIRARQIISQKSNKPPTCTSELAISRLFLLQDQRLLRPKIAEAQFRQGEREQYHQFNIYTNVQAQEVQQELPVPWCP